MTTISEEIKEIFDDPDVKFGSVIRTLAMEFGQEATLKDINNIFQASRPLPSRTIDGETFMAGYRGESMVEEGEYTDVKLVEIRQNGDMCKAMFAFSSGQFLYWSVPKDDLRIEQIVSLAQRIGDTFTVQVAHDVIKSTGEKHAKISAINNA